MFKYFFEGVIMKKLVEVVCCDGCGEQISDPQKHETDVSLSDCNVRVTLAVARPPQFLSVPPELCSHCMEKVCHTLATHGF